MGHMGKEPEDTRVPGHFLYRTLAAFLHLQFPNSPGWLGGLSSARVGYSWA